MASAGIVQSVHDAWQTSRQRRVIADLATIKATTAETAGAFALAEVRTPSGGGFPMHAQRYDDATYLVIDGAYRFRVAADEFELAPGGCMFVPRGTVHGYANLGDIAARMLVIASPGGVWERFVAEIGNDPERPPWRPDMTQALAVAPKYGIELVSAESNEPAFGPASTGP